MNRITMCLLSTLCCYSAISQAASNLKGNFEDFFDSCVPVTALNPYGTPPPSRGVDLGWACLGVTTISPLLWTISSFLESTDNTANRKNDTIHAAKDDAQAYVAVNGEDYHTAKLELAFQHIKKHYPDATSMQMAQAIVAY